VIIGNLRASRLTLLYAQSGVGKSSLLRAGVAARLRQQAERSSAEEGTPRSLPIVFDAWRDDPVAGLVQEIEAAARTFLNSGSKLDLPHDRVDDAIASATEALDATALVMLDQFEEYFLYHAGDEAGERFADALARCVGRDDLRVNFLISIREDVYSNIGDRFQARIPDVYGNYLHLDYLDRGAARDAIREPIEQLNRRLSLPNEARFRIEPELVEDVLEQVRRGREKVGDRRQPEIEGAAPADATERFETAYLQLVMERLWDEETGEGSRVLRAETLRRLGGADAIIQRHVDTAMAELSADQRDAMGAAFRYLVTSAGRKIALTTRELSEFAERPATELEPALRHLESKRIVRAVAAPGSPAGGSERAGDGAGTRWELFHDVLADPILSWRLERDARRAQQRVREAQDETRRAKRRSLVLLGLAVAASLGFVLAVVSWFRAVEAGNETNSQELAAASVAALSNDPHQSVLLALDGLDEAETIEAENALRLALPASRVRSILPHAGGDSGAAQARQARTSFVTDATFGPGDTLATGESTGRVRVWHWPTKRELIRLREPDWVSDVQFADTGRLLLTTAAARASLWDVDRCAADRRCEPVRTWRNQSLWAAGVGGDGCVVATSVGRDVRLDGLSGCDGPERCRTRRRQTLHPDGAVVWLAFARGSCVLATTTTDGKVSVWRARGGRYHLAHRMDVGWYQAEYVALSPSGHLAAAAGSRSVRVWDLRRCKGAGDDPTSCDRIWWDSTPDWVNSVSFHPDERHFAVATEDGVGRVWDLNAADPLLVLRGHRDTVFSAAFDSTGRHIATASADATTRVWTTAAGKVASRSRAPISDTRFMARGRRIIAASDDGTVRIYERGGSGREEAVLLVTASSKILSPAERRRWGETDPFDPFRFAEVTAAAPSPDGRWIVTGTSEGDLQRWNVRDCVREFVCEWWQGDYFAPSNTPSFEYVNGIAYDPRGRLVAVAWSYGGTWILSAGGERRAVVLKNTEVQSTGVAFNPDGSRLVTTSYDGNARVWDVSECTRGRCEPRRVRILRHGCGVYTARFSPDGRRVITGCGDRIARIWTWRDPDAPPVVLRGHTSNIRAVAFTHGGRRAITAGTDRTTRIWDATTGRLLGVLQMHTDRVQSVAVDPRDPEVILTSSDDGTARLYRCTTCGSLDELRGLAENMREAVDRRPRLLR
jgi:WD40 repeat protein